MVPPTLQFPLDSLYKFETIAGIVLVVVSIFVPLRLFYDLRIRELQIQVEIAEKKAKYETWVAGEARLQKEWREHEQHKEWFRDFVERNPREKAPEDMKKFQQDMAEKLDNKWDFFFSEATKNVERAADADAAIAAAKAKVAELAFLKWTAYASAGCFGLLMIVGGFMAGHGFYNWYGKVQIHQDTILATDAKAKQETKSNRPHGSF